MLRAFLRGLLEFRHGLVDGVHVGVHAGVGLQVHVLVHQHHAAVALDLGPAVETGEGFCQGVGTVGDDFLPALGELLHVVFGGTGGDPDQGVLQAAASFFIIPPRGGRYRLPERLLVTSII